MNYSLLNTEVQQFIDSNLNSDINYLALKGSPFPSIETKELIEQIEAKKKCEHKLPTWFQTENIYYPNKLNIEQTSSEVTSDYKATLVQGKTLLDLTGGFGVDAYYFSKRFDSVVHCEIDEELSRIVEHNFSQLQVENVQCLPLDGIEYLKTTNNKFDVIYLDPSRRHGTKGKVFRFEDSQPNVLEHLDLLFEHAGKILIKTSPLLDISLGLKQLRNVTALHVVAVQNEVKELLWQLDSNSNSGTEIKTINFQTNTFQTFDFLYESEANAKYSLSPPLAYLYEPNAAILKSGGFQSLAEHFDLEKLHKHSHLYTSKNLIDFPGRRFTIEKVIPFNNIGVKRLALEKANISTRNFPLTVHQLRKKFSIKDGGDNYLFFTTNSEDEKIVVCCSKAE